MKVGVNLLNFGPGVSPESLSRWTEIAETLGYHLVMISDHVAVTPDVEGRYPAPLCTTRSPRFRGWPPRLAGLRWAPPS